MPTVIPRPPAAAGLAMVLALLAITGAWFFQLVIDLVPCPLCLQQRWPYYLGLPAIAAGLAMYSNPLYQSTARHFFAAAAVAFLIGAGLGVYHAGVEWGWWQGPTGCAAGAGVALDAGSLLQQMATTRVVPCDEAAWRFLGLSLAGYNALVSLAVAALLLVAARGAGALCAKV